MRSVEAFVANNKLARFCVEGISGHFGKARVFGGIDYFDASSVFMFKDVRLMQYAHFPSK